MAQTQKTTDSGNAASVIDSLLRFIGDLSLGSVITSVVIW